MVNAIAAYIQQVDEEAFDLPIHDVKGSVDALPQGYHVVSFTRGGIAPYYLGKPIGLGVEMAATFEGACALIAIHCLINWMRQLPVALEALRRRAELEQSVSDILSTQTAYSISESINGMYTARVIHKFDYIIWPSGCDPNPDVVEDMVSNGDARKVTDAQLYVLASLRYKRIRAKRNSIQLSKPLAENPLFIHFFNEWANAYEACGRYGVRYYVSIETYQACIHEIAGLCEENGWPTSSIVLVVDYYITPDMPGVRLATDWIHNGWKDIIGNHYEEAYQIGSLVVAVKEIRGLKYSQLFDATSRLPLVEPVYYPFSLKTLLEEGVETLAGLCNWSQFQTYPRPFQNMLRESVEAVYYHLSTDIKTSLLDQHTPLLADFKGL